MTVWQTAISKCGAGMMDTYARSRMISNGLLPSTKQTPGWPGLTRQLAHKTQSQLLPTQCLTGWAASGDGSLTGVFRLLVGEDGPSS
jgi:hypothetical protein